jgi:hypothetical protein
LRVVPAKALWLAPTSNPMRIWNAWCSLSLQAMGLAWDAQGVIALRCMRIARESADGRRSETQGMVTEKIAALTEAQVAALTGAMSGGGHRAAKKALGVYKKRVRRNKKRLARKL